MTLEVTRAQADRLAKLMQQGWLVVMTRSHVKGMPVYMQKAGHTISVGLDGTVRF